MPERNSHRIAARVVSIWVLTRGAMAALAVLAEPAIRGDVTYYAAGLHGWLHGGSLATTLPEYPLPAVGIVLPQYLIAGEQITTYLVAFFVSMLVVDAAFTWLLFRSGSGHRRYTASTALTFWLWWLPVLGPIVFLRFDLVPACATAAALLLTAGRRTRPAIAGAAVAVGAAIKLWPVLILPVLLLRAVRRRSLVLGFVVTGAVIGGAALALGGWGRLTSPLHWQSDRGLQIESIVATPFMVLRALNPTGPWQESYTRFKAYELLGPGTQAGAALADAALYVAIGVLAWLWWRARRCGAGVAVPWLVVSTALLLTITDKALSPQYLLWSAAPLAALLVTHPHDREARTVAATLAVAAALTQVEYPLAYESLVGSGPSAGTVTGILLVRNLLLVAAAALAVQKCLQVTGRRAAVVEQSDEASRAGLPADA